MKQISEFLLLGFSEDSELQSLLFGLFLSMYLFTIFGNLLIILATITDSHLHMPMYFFPSNLSFVDICLTSKTVPKMLVNIQTQRRVIANEFCLIKMYFFLLFVGLDDILLTMMAYDHFIAISHPLHYAVIMNPWLCVLLVLGTWVIIFLNALLQNSLVFHLSFLVPLEISHFFCEINQMVQLACSDSFLNEIVMYLSAEMLAGGPFISIVYSYSTIVSSMYAISSALGKYKAFSTCASHLTVGSLFIVCVDVYMSYFLTHNKNTNSQASVMYTSMLNPFIYSLRNKEIKGALKRCLGGKP